MTAAYDCQRWHEALVAQVLGELDATVAAELRAHLVQCHACRGLAAGLVKEEEELRAAFALTAQRGALRQHGVGQETGAGIGVRSPTLTAFRKISFPGRWVAAAAAVAALLVAIGIWPGDRSARPAYGMSDIPQLLRDVIVHVRGETYVPTIPTAQCPERRKIDCEYWLDLATGRLRQTYYSYSISPAGTEISLGEKVSDGQYLMELNHSARTVEYRRLNDFHRALQTRRTVMTFYEQFFGGNGVLEDFVKVGEESIAGASYTLWELDQAEPLLGMAFRVHCALAPLSGAIGYVRCWLRPAHDAEWLEVLHLTQWERRAAAPPGTFDTTPPREYALKNTKQTADLPELNCGGGCANGLAYRQYISFRLPDGSIILAWNSADQLSHQPQDGLFADLEFGGPLPRLPLEFVGLRQSFEGRELYYVGRHLACTRTGDGTVEWSIYVPQQTPAASRWRTYYEVVHRFNVPDGRVLPIIVANVSTPLWIDGPTDFDTLVRGAMRELSDQQPLPDEVTFERVMALARGVRSVGASEAVGGS